MRRAWIAAAKRNPRLVGYGKARPPPRPGTIAAVLARVRKLCAGLPDVEETTTWEKPHFRVGDKIFLGCGDPSDPLAIGLKLAPEHAEVCYRTDVRFKRAAYVGRHGWVTLDLSGRRDWAEVYALIEESYRLIASKASVAKLDGRRGAPPAAARRRRRR